MCSDASLGPGVSVQQSRTSSIGDSLWSCSMSKNLSINTLSAVELAEIAVRLIEFNRK